MESVKVSSKFRIALPRLVRESLGIVPRQRLVVFGYTDQIVIVPEWPIQEARGSLKVIETTIEREKGNV